SVSPRRRKRSRYNLLGRVVSVSASAVIFDNEEEDEVVDIVNMHQNENENSGLMELGLPSPEPDHNDLGFGPLSGEGAMLVDDTSMQATTTIGPDRDMYTEVTPLKGAPSGMPDPHVDITRLNRPEYPIMV
ncbi:unnamed protein product, partial [Amoebophrya sp. A25]